MSVVTEFLAWLPFGIVVATASFAVILFLAMKVLLPVVITVLVWCWSLGAVVSGNLKWPTKR